MTDKVFVDGDNHFTEDEILIIAKNHVKQLGRDITLFLKVKFCDGECECYCDLRMDKDFSYKYVVTTLALSYTFHDEYQSFEFKGYMEMQNYLNGIIKLHAERLLAQATKTLNTLKSLGYY